MRLAGVVTPGGRFTLRPFDRARDLERLHAWMNDPAVARFWALDGPLARLAAHLEQQAAATHSEPYVGLLDDVPMSYWEIYRAQYDRLAGYYPAQPGDAGIHLLLGPASFRGLGLGSHLIRAVADRLLVQPDTDRVVAEPDVGNGASLRAFERAGFRRTRDITMPEKTAGLMVRDRAPTTSHDLGDAGDQA